MSKPILGFIGFGEAAFSICKGLKLNSASEIYVFDVMLQDDKLRPIIQQKAEDIGVGLKMSLSDLIEQCEFILCATSAKVALTIAQDAVRSLRTGKIYADLNSASPTIKRKIGTIIEDSGALFVDCAIMEIVSPLLHKVPISASGKGAAVFVDSLNKMGMNVRYINDLSGSASSLKMFRSIFMKGMTALLIEALLAAYKTGVCDDVFASISQTIRENDLTTLTNLLLNRTAIGADRRISEMEDAETTLRELDLPAFVTHGTIQRLQWLKDLRVKEYFQGNAPADFREVFKAIEELLSKRP